MKTAVLFILYLSLFMSILTTPYADPINLTGTIKNQAGTPVAGAKIVLAGDNTLTAETDKTGLFTITGEITAAGIRKALGRMSPVTVHGATVQVILQKTSSVAITVYAISGQQLYRYCAKWHRTSGTMWEAVSLIS